MKIRKKTREIKKVPAEVVTELKTIPQILSTQIFGVPFWDVDFLLLLVAQGILIQSVLQSNPTLLPSEGDPPEKIYSLFAILKISDGANIQLSAGPSSAFWVWGG